MKSNTAIGFAIMVALSTVPGIILGTENVLSLVEDEGLVSHDPILIVGDFNFTQEKGVTSGSGTESNPYIIENYRIESDGYGISITDTSVYFIIRGCKIENGSSGIELQRVNNGIIENNIINNNKEFDINIYYSNNNIIRNNLCVSVEAESNINLVASSGNLIEKNQITGSSDWKNVTNEEQTKNGINLNKDYMINIWTNSGSNKIRGNLVLNHSKKGIWIRSDDNIIEGNFLSNESNGVLNEGSNNVISGNEIKGCKYGIYNWYCPSHILNNTCRGNKWGIFTIGTSSYNKEYRKDYLTYITNNTCMNNSEVGISLYKPGFDVQKNTISNNGKDGIKAILDCVDDKGASLVHNNLFKRNGGYGLAIKGDHTNETAGFATISIFGNDFIENGMTPQCEGTPKNIWNTSFYGNYWSDWTSPDVNGDGIVDKPYVVNSTYNISDLRPITAPYDEWFNRNGELSVLEIFGTDIMVTMVNKTYSSTYSVVGPGNNHAWVLNTNASWLYLSGSIISGTPDYDDVGDYWVNISVSWNELIDWRNFTLEVVFQDSEEWNEENNYAPYGATIYQPTSAPKEGVPFVLSANAFDKDIPYGDELRYEWFIDGMGSVGVGSNITLNLGEGTYTVRLKVTDSYNKTLEVTSDIIVIGVQSNTIKGPLIAFFAIAVILLLGTMVIIIRKKLWKARYNINHKLSTQLTGDPVSPFDPFKRPSQFHGDLDVRKGPLGPFQSNSGDINISMLESAPFEGIRRPLDERREELRMLLEMKREDYDARTYIALRDMVREE